MKKVLGILILVLFLGTAMAGLAQGSHGLPPQEKVGSGTPGEIKPYIIVKRTTGDQNPLDKWGGSAVQNDKYGIDLVVRVSGYVAHFSGYSELGFNATVIAAGDAYFLGRHYYGDETPDGGWYDEYLKMKSLEIAASKDTVPNQIPDNLVKVEIADKSTIVIHNLTMEKSKEAKWFKEMRPVAENVTGMVAGIVAGYGSAATGPLAPFVSLGCRRRSESRHTHAAERDGEACHK